MAIPPREIIRSAALAPTIVIGLIPREIVLRKDAAASSRAAADAAR